MLKVNNIEVIYSSVILSLRGVSLEVPDEKVIALLGANGAGKTTTLNAISCLLKPELGEVTHGNIEFEGLRIDRKSPQEVAAMGISQVMEGRTLYQHLTVEENLKLGAYLLRRNDVIRDQLEIAFNYFPRLKDLRNKISGYLSGGEQQMLVIGRSLMGKPKLMLVDEASLGLAPLLIKSLFEAIKAIKSKRLRSCWWNRMPILPLK
jgi:branched-chain amino acid transport system ATP-binding protein